MAIRILTGIIVPDSNRRTGGTAVISFEPHQVAGDANGVELSTAGRRSGRFRRAPGKSISLREVKVRDKDSFSGGSHNDFLRIHDNGLNRDQVEIEWGATGGSEIREISYIITGDV